MTISQAVDQTRQKYPSLVQVVQRLQPEIARALPKHMDADRMARLALTVLRQTPALAKCSPESFAGALLTAAALGLEPGVNQEAYLVPYGTECQFIAGWQGLCKLFWQHPLAKHLDAQAVFEHDDFDYAYGLRPYLTHKPARGDRGKIVEYYAVASLTTGAEVFEVMSPDEVAAVRKAGGNRRSNIADPQHWMERKTVLRQLVKRLPKSTLLAHALAADERSGTELVAQHVPEAITAGHDVIDVETGEITTGEDEWPAVAEVAQ